MSVFYDLNKTPRNILNQAIVRAIVSENNGAWFDPSDMSTMFQDAAGTTPVTAVEQPVGLMLDKARGLMLGPELVSNGDFSGGSAGWTLESGWAVSDGKLTYTANTGRNASKSIQTSADKAYLVSYDVLDIQASGIGVYSPNSSNITSVNTYHTTIGKKTALIIATGSSAIINFRSSSTVSPLITIDNISVRELYGYHATQSITASRPTLSARYNLGLSTEDIRSYYLFTAGGSAVGPQTVACDATNDASIRFVEFNVGSGSIRQAPRVGTFSFSCELKRSAGSPITSVGFNLDEGDCTISANTVPSGAITLTDNWVKYSGTVTVSAVGTVWRVWVWRKGTSPVGNFDIRNIHINEGATLLPYQRVNTATDYDTDERYFPKYLQFSPLVAIDDYLNLPYMSLYNGGAASIVCARDAVSQATDTYIISERSTTDADPKYFPSRQLASGGNMDTYITDDAGAVVLDTVGSPFSGVANAVIRSIVDSGNNLKLFKNGVLAANDNYTRSGALTLNNTTIGASVSTTTSNYASMKLYGLIVTKSALTDAQRITCERYLGRKSGVQL